MKKNFINYINEQLNIDLNKIATEKQFAPRTGLNIDIRKLSKNEFNLLKYFTVRNNITFECNGINEYFIYFKR